MTTARLQHGAPLVLPIAAAWGLLGLSIAIVHEPSDWRATVGVLALSQAVTGGLMWYRFGITRLAVMPDFLTMFLFTQFVGKSVTGLGVVIDANRDPAGLVGDLLSLEQSVPWEYQFQAEVIFLLATLAFSVTWRLLEGRTPLAIWEEPAPKAMWWGYAIGLVAHASLLGTPLAQSAGMTHELFRMFSIGAVAVLLGGQTEYALGRRMSAVPLFALVPWYALALRSGMKGEFALVSLPILLPMFRNPSPRRLVFLGGYLAVVVLFLFPFSYAWRSANWSGPQGQQNASIQVVASRVSASWQSVGLAETGATSTAQWLSRGSSAQAGGLVMQLADSDGLLGPVMLTGLATILVPRIIWPEKPLYTPGAWFTWYLGKASSPETATSATAMMLPTELYWMFGLRGVLVGMPVIAAIYFLVWRRLAWLASRGIVPLLALFALLARSAQMEGVYAIYAISSPIMLLVYVLVFDQLQRRMFPGIGGSVLSRRFS